MKHDSHDSVGASNSLVLELQICDEHVHLPLVIAMLGDYKASVTGVKVGHKNGCKTWTITINIESFQRGEELVMSLKHLEGVSVLNVDDLTVHMHRRGKLQVVPRYPMRTKAQLARGYTPGVGRIMDMIKRDPRLARHLTTIGDRVGIFSNATRLLNRGHCSMEEAMVVLEGKAAIASTFGGFSMWPMPIETLDPDKIIEHIQLIGKTYGGFVIEDIQSPDCWYILDKLRETLPGFIFHDDADGTAVVVAAATINAAKVVGKKLEDLYVVGSGTGAAGSRCLKVLAAAGVRSIVGINAGGAIYPGRPGLSSREQWLADNTNRQNFRGTTQEALRGADMFLGLSTSNVIKGSDLLVMNCKPIVFALTNPVPEVPVKDARVAIEQLGGGVIATGSSEDVNQINNSNAFPGILRGALDIAARDFTDEMLLAAARAMASMIPDNELGPDNIIVNIEERPEVHEVVAESIRRTGNRSR